MEFENLKVKSQMAEITENLQEKLETIKKLKDKNFELNQEVRGQATITEDLENRITILYKTIDENNEKILKYEIEIDLKTSMAVSLEAHLKVSNDGRIDVEKKIEQLERDRLMLKDELQQLRVFNNELYNRVVDGETQLGKANVEIDVLTLK
jgi:chromosome segregation ATPase